jgi:hypothetical protein
MHGTLENSSLWHFDCSLHVWRLTLPMRKLVLAICLLSIAAPFLSPTSGALALAIRARLCFCIEPSVPSR